jgi:multiple sugar transport system permease protein
MRSERLTALWLVLPAVVILLLVAGYPLVDAVLVSLHRRLPIFDVNEFIGLGYYRFMWGDPRFWNALGNTAYFTAVSVAFELVLGLALALGLRRAFPGRALLRAAVLVPWAVPTVVSARLWAWMFTPGYGLVGYLIGRPETDWLGSPRLALHVAILVDVWKTVPFVALLLLAALQAIPKDLYGAAAIDGATPWRMFREITLPLLAPAIAVAGVFRALDAFRVFDAVFVLTGGGPADTTETLSIYAYKVLFSTLQFGYGSALSVATFVCVLGIAAVGAGWLTRQRGLLE